MPDMLVNLYQMPDSKPFYQRVEDGGIRIVRALAPSRAKVIDFVRENFSDGWVGETEAAMSANPCTCFIAIKNGEVIGFANYNATGKGYFGPTGVKESEREQGIGAALLLKCLEAMKEEGYGYGIIGWAGPTHFYERCCNARVIENDQPNIYSRMV